MLGATTIMRAHDVSSVRNRSRCSVYKRTNTNIDPNMGDKKRNKTQSKKCGCTFKFTILYDNHHKLWFKKRRRIALSNAESKMDYHLNHIKIDPIHMYHARKDLPDNVVKSINKTIIPLLVNIRAPICAQYVKWAHFNNSFKISPISILTSEIDSA